MSSLYSEAELPGLSAGEIRLKGGRVSGLWKVSRGEGGHCTVHSTVHCTVPRVT